MTDIVLLAHKLYQRVEWQNVPSEVNESDLTVLIADAIRDLYVMTGRALHFDENKFEFDGETYLSFADDLPLDEREYVILTAEISLLKKVQMDVNQLTSYSTDAMTVTHGDKPFANLQQTIEGVEDERLRVWFKMGRFHLL